MMEVLITAICSLVGSLSATLAGIIINTKLSNYRIAQLEKKVDKHNNLIERVYLIEKHNAVVDEEIKTVYHRIADLEEK